MIHISFFNFWMHFSSPWNSRVQGISSPPWTKSDEYLQFPITIHNISLPSCIYMLHICEIFFSKCPIVLPESFFTATVYRSTMLPISLSYLILLQKLQPKFLCIHGNLECTSPYEIPLFRQLAFNRSNYMWGLDYHKRYHTWELMSFHFISVVNFIRNKNPLYGITSCSIVSLLIRLCSLETLIASYFCPSVTKFLTPVFILFSTWLGWFL